MSTDRRHTNEFLKRLLHERSLEKLKSQLSPNFSSPKPRMPGSSRLTTAAVERRWRVLREHSATTDKRVGEIQNDLLDPLTTSQMEFYEHNIENFIGAVRLPLGIAGPLRVNGIFAQGDYYVPLATTEAALVASYHRGALLISEAGGCAALLLNEGVSRSPGFAFKTLADAGQFAVWTTTQWENFKQYAEETTRYGKLIDMRLTIEGNHVYLTFEFTTGDAAGQNMVTIATDAVCDYITAHSPITPEYSFVEANFSGDKKASALSFLSVRGKKVSAEVIIPAELVQQRLHTSAEQMVNYWRMSAVGGVLSSSIGVQGHYANGLAALYIACGQDAACVAESAVGVTRFELTPEGALYAAVTLPNLIVGTVGGGTGLPTQRACLELMGLYGDNNAQALAEVCAALVLAGELSIVGALCSGDFASAHERMARAGHQSRRQDAKNGAKNITELQTEAQHE